MQHTPEPVLSPEGDPLSLGRGYQPASTGPQIAHEGSALSLGEAYRPSWEQQGIPRGDEVVLDGKRLKLQAGYATRGHNPYAPAAHVQQPMHGTKARKLPGAGQLTTQAGQSGTKDVPVSVLWRFSDNTDCANSNWGVLAGPQSRPPRS